MVKFNKFIILALLLAKCFTFNLVAQDVLISGALNSIKKNLINEGYKCFNLYYNAYSMKLDTGLISFFKDKLNRKEDWELLDESCIKYKKDTTELEWNKFKIKGIKILDNIKSEKIFRLNYHAEIDLVSKKLDGCNQVIYLSNPLFFSNDEFLIIEITRLFTRSAGRGDAYLLKRSKNNKWIQIAKRNTNAI